MLPVWSKNYLFPVCRNLEKAGHDYPGLKNAGLIQGELKPPKIKYCINQENWKIAKALFQHFFDWLFYNSETVN